MAGEIDPGSLLQVNQRSELYKMTEFKVAAGSKGGVVGVGVAVVAVVAAAAAAAEVAGILCLYCNPRQLDSFLFFLLLFLARIKHCVDCDRGLRRRRS